MAPWPMYPTVGFIVTNPPLQDAVGRQPDRVADALGFEKLVHLGVAESRIAAEVEALHDPPVAGNTGSSTARQPSALCTLPGVKAHRSTSPN